MKRIINITLLALLLASTQAFSADNNTDIKAKIESTISQISNNEPIHNNLNSLLFDMRHHLAANNTDIKAKITSTMFQVFQGQPIDMKNLSDLLSDTLKAITASSSSYNPASSTTPSFRAELTAQHACRWEECNETFENAAELDNHAISHIKINSGDCLWHDCKNTFMDLKEHIVQHNNHYRETCNLCYEKLKNKNALYTHRSRKHPEETSRRKRKHDKRNNKNQNSETYSESKRQREANSSAASMQATRQATAIFFTKNTPSSSDSEDALTVVTDN